MNSTVTQQQPLTKQLPAWRLWAPLLLQTGLILAIPAQAIYTQIIGKTVILQTLPVDPYDFLRGYSQTLSYHISRIDRLQKLPGWNELEKSSPPASKYLATGTKFYVVMEAPGASQLEPPLAWKPVRVSQDLPTNLPANQVAIVGRSTGSIVEYGLERYYMPESRQDEINQNISQAQRDGQQSIVVEAKVDAQGKVVPISFWVRDRNYRF